MLLPRLILKPVELGTSGASVPKHERFRVPVPLGELLGIWQRSKWLEPDLLAYVSIFCSDMNYEILVMNPET